MSEKTSFRCALTGHRALPPDFDGNALYDKLEELIVKGCDTFYCGMAQGFDLTALNFLVQLRRKYRFQIEACIPFEGHERRFSYAEQRLFYELLEWCDRKTVSCPGYSKGSFLKRDRYMVDNADVVLAFCRKSEGGTAYTVEYALKKKIPVIFL